MSDAIRIRGLRVDARVGVTEEERSTPQTLRIDIEIEADLTSAGKTDRLEDTLDYDAVTRKVAEAVRGSEAHLLEHVGDRIIAAIAPMDAVRAVTVEVSKPELKMAEDVDEVSVRVSRSLR